MRASRTGAAQAAAALCGAVLVLVALAAPTLGNAVLAAAELGGAAVVAVVLARRGHLRSRVGGGVVVVLTLLGASRALQAGVGPENAAALALLVAAQVLGLALFAPVLTRHRRGAPPETAAMRAAELGTVVTGLVVAVLASAAAARAAGADTWSTVAAGCDVVALGVVVWLLLTRTGSPVPALLLMGGSGLLVAQNVAAVVAGEAIGSAGEVGKPLGVVAALVLAAAGAHPRVHEVGRPSSTPLLRGGVTRLVVELPFALGPVVAWAVGVWVPSAAVPVWVLFSAATLLSLLALGRALGLVAEAERQADTDVLTGRLGRRGGLRRLDALHAAHRPTWVCLVDLDEFTEVNQRHGQEVGDELLRAVLERLVERAPRGSVVARLGGDEVLVLVAADGSPPVAADVVAQQLLSAFAEPFPAHGKAVSVSASVGVAALVDEESSRDALGRADVAVRAAKARGGGRWLRHAPAMEEEVLGPLRLQRELRALLACEGPAGGDCDGAGGERMGSADGVGRLVVSYQPVVDLASGHPRSVEALVRWEHPLHGVLPPDSFLPLAEAVGLGAALDLAVLRQALHQLAAWDALGLDVSRTSVNLGRASMLEPGLRERVLGACAEAGLGADRLMLEITEHDELVTDAGVVADLLALRALGASVALDDFGAGHASVGYLRRWPANVVKLDRSLLPSVAPARPHPDMLDPRDLIVAVGSLVTALGRHLLVEGVEDEADLAVAIDAGAEYGQGYYWARPMPSAELIAWWRRRTSCPVLEAAVERSPHR